MSIGTSRILIKDRGRGRVTTTLFPGAEIKCEGWQQLTCSSLLALTRKEKLSSSQLAALPEESVGILTLHGMSFPVTEAFLGSEFRFVGNYEGEALYSFSRPLRSFFWNGDCALTIALPGGETVVADPGTYIAVVSYPEIFLPLPDEVAPT